MSWVARVREDEGEGAPPALALAPEVRPDERAAGA